VVSGGFAEIGAEGVSVLAEKAIPVNEMTRGHLDELISEARAAFEAAEAAYEGPHGLVDDAAKLLADMEALGGHINI
jgi:F-type H+-transporting ATPase subunit epsilon